MEQFKPGAEKSEQQKLERVAEVLKSGFDQLVIHGDFHHEGNKSQLKLRSDLDAMGGVFLMDLAGINYKMVTFVPKGKELAGAVHIDTGGKPKLTMEEDGSIFFDHHSSEKGPSTSATAIVYESLTKAGLLKKEAWLDNFSKFVTEIDNLDYPIDENFLKNDWWRTPYGTYKALPLSFITKLFQEGRDPRQPFAEDEAKKIIVKESKGKKITLWDICLNNKGLMRISLNGIEEAKQRVQQGQVKPESAELGKVLLNIVETNRDPKTGQLKQRNKIPLGFTAAKALGFDTYALWSFASNSFFLTSQTNKLAAAFKRLHEAFPAVQLIRGTMVINPPSERGTSYHEKEVQLNKFLNYLSI